MQKIGAHAQVTIYQVGGWDSAVHSPAERYGATCATCGVWRAASVTALRDALSATSCGPPFTVPADTMPAHVVAELLGHTRAP